MLENVQDILYIIISMLDLETSSKLVCVSKNLSIYGYLRHLKYKNIKTFIKKCSVHYRTLNSIEFNDIKDPHLFMPIYFPILLFINCNFTDNIFNPEYSVKVEEIVYVENNRNKNKKIFQINWKKLPNLKSIDFFVYDIDIFLIPLYIKNIKINKFND